MVTTIQVSKELKTALEKHKISTNETYEEVIWGLVEDRMELSDETKKAIDRARIDVAAGRTIPLADIKKKYGIK